MSIKNDIIIQDACILIDLIDLELLDAFFELKLQVFTTPQVIAEIIDSEQRSMVDNHLDYGNITLDGLGNDDEIFSIFGMYPGLSLTDSSVLELASRLGGMLLSTDSGLRNVALSRGLEVRRVLWVIEQLVKNRVITNGEAIEKLEQYPRVNERAPKQDIKRLIDKLLND